MQLLISYVSIRSIYNRVETNVRTYALHRSEDNEHDGVYTNRTEDTKDTNNHVAKDKDWFRVI